MNYHLTMSACREYIHVYVTVSVHQPPIHCKMLKLRQMYMCICKMYVDYVDVLLSTTFYNLLFQSYNVCYIEHSQVKNYTILRKTCFVYQAHVFHSMNSTLYMYMYMYRYFEVNVTSLPSKCLLKESFRLGQ